MSEFVVEVNHEAVARTRAMLLRTKRSSAWATAIGGGLIFACGVGIALITGFQTASWPLSALVVIPGLILGFDARRQFAAARRMRATWATAGIPPEAMRLSGEGLHCRIDAAPDSCFLPWSTVAAFHLKGGRLLVLELAPGVTATTPGVSGLDQPGVQRALRRKSFGFNGIPFAIGSLRRPPEEIDQALASFTDGRVRIR